MEFHLLGPVQVVANGREERLASGRARSLLAALAWQAGDLVSDEKLIEIIWGDQRPADPRDSLYTCGKRLRKLLESHSKGAGHHLVRLRGGYLLEVDPDHVDINRFRQLVRTARVSGTDVSSACVYESGLRLWRGNPLADVDSAWADRVRHTLGREHLATRVAAVRAWMKAGRHEEVLPELLQLVDEQPLDESITAMAMLGLSRSGRQPEALARYARLRRRLVAEVGDEPGPELRDTHQEILSRNSTNFLWN